MESDQSNQATSAEAGPVGDGLPADVPPRPPGQPLADFLLNLEEYTPTVSVQEYFVQWI